MKITAIGLDLAKNVYQVHATNGVGEVVVRKAMRRAQVLRFFERLDPCLVGIEACGTSHYWAREDSQVWPRGPSDASGLCEALRQARERPMRATPH
jgi:transposase